MIKGVIFDFNGTLIDDFDLHIQAWKILSKKYFNKNITEDDFNNKLNGITNYEILKILSDNKIDDIENKKLSKEKESIYRELVKNTPLIDGALDLFKKLKKDNIPFTIASASIKENIDFFVENYNLSKYMDINKIVYDNGEFKDKKEMYLKTFKIMNLNPNDTLIFEDSLHGIKAALNAGCNKVVGIYNKRLEDKYSSLNIKIINDFTDFNYQEL